MPASSVPKSAVYTALVGGYEAINDEQEIGDGSVPFVCFTDDPTLTSTVWEVRPIEPLFARDLQRSQREIKIRGCDDLVQFERTLYIDNSVSLTVPPRAILDGWLAEHDLAIPLHSFRATVLDEFLAVLESGLDDSARVYEQLYHYSETARAILDERPLWNGMIARRNTPDVDRLMRRWCDEVFRYSRRDQLSANVIFAASEVEINRMELDNHQSDLHRWPVAIGRPHQLTRNARSLAVPELARVRQLELQLAAQLEMNETQLRLNEIQLQLNAMKDKSIEELQATRSWKLARKLSLVASKLNLTRRKETAKETKWTSE